MESITQTQVAIIGAGPAGLTAAYLLAKEGRSVIVLEKDPNYVGGISRTVTYKGYCFDIGGHRFFSKSQEVEMLWEEILPNDMLDRPRSSRIFYRRHFFAYPLKALDALFKLGFIESFLCVLSYLKSKLFPIKDVKNFSDWVTNQFGKRLFNTFFKTYTEKVWGMRCDEISADWAAQRIKGLSLFTAIVNATLPKSWFSTKKDRVIKTLIDNFRYPRKGPGMLWEACEKKIKNHGGDVLTGSDVYQCEYHEAEQQWHVFYRDQAGMTHKLIANHIISSAPLRELILDYLPTVNNALSPGAQEAAAKLQYRDFLIVILMLHDKNSFPDNWIYIHDPDVDVARIQNFKSWSPEMIPTPGMCCYGMEYFCFDHDKTWSAEDSELIEKAKKELIRLGLAKSEDITDGCVIRQPKAYPVYDNDYQMHVQTIRKELEMKFPTLHPVGRNGMHKYNNQDHAMMTAMLTVKNILADKKIYDIWQVNQDAEYIEDGNAGENNLLSGLRDVPTRV